MRCRRPRLKLCHGPKRCAASRPRFCALRADGHGRAQVLSGVYASLGEQFADGAMFDGSVVRQAIKGSILAAMSEPQ